MEPAKTSMFQQLVLKLTFAILVCTISEISIAEEPQHVDGNWLKREVDAYNRVMVTGNASLEDGVNSSMMIGYVYGVLAVHQTNNIYVGVHVLTCNRKRQNPGDKELKFFPCSKAELAALRFLAPLPNLPNALDVPQAVAILQKYLEAHPERWGDPAEFLITTAFGEAFRSH